MLKGYLFTFLWSLVPVLELRAAIPLGYLTYHLSIYEAVIVASLGGIFSAGLIIYLLPLIVEFTDKHVPFFHRILQRIFLYTRTKHSHRMEIFGEIALVIFVAIPIPGSGAWTGALLAYLFGLPRYLALWLISLGVFLSGIIVALLTVSGIEVWKFFNGFE